MWFLYIHELYGIGEPATTHGFGVDSAKELTTIQNVDGHIDALVSGRH